MSSLLSPINLGENVGRGDFFLPKEFAGKQRKQPCEYVFRVWIHHHPGSGGAMTDEETKIPRFFFSFLRWQGGGRQGRGSFFRPREGRMVWDDLDFCGSVCKITLPGFKKPVPLLLPPSPHLGFDWHIRAANVSSSSSIEELQMCVPFCSVGRCGVYLRFSPHVRCCFFSFSLSSFFLPSIRLRLLPPSHAHVFLGIFLSSVAGTEPCLLGHLR